MVEKRCGFQKEVLRAIGRMVLPHENSYLTGC